MGKSIKFDSDLYNKLCLSYIEKYNKPEEWKRVIIDGITTKYMISNYGRIFDVDKKKIPPIYLHRDHYRISLTFDTGKRKCIGTYRLVALMFLPTPQKYLDKGYTIDELVVDHKREGDIDNFDDNTVWNLQWLTYRENTSKASKCGYREAFSYDFKEKLDNMILNGYKNKEIYEMCLNEYGYEKQEIKSMIQVRRRRLGKTLKEHHENDIELVKKIDELLKEGYSNDEIINLLDMSTEGRSTGRLLQYRRSLLKIPAQTSKYFSESDNEKLKELIIKGLNNQDIIDYFKLNNLDSETLTKIKRTIASRRVQYKKQFASSTTRES